MEPSLLGPTPRRVRLRARKAPVFLCFPILAALGILAVGYGLYLCACLGVYAAGGTLLLLGASLVVGGLLFARLIAQERTLYECGRPAVGRITALDKQTDTDSGGHQRASYGYAYAFPTEDGVTHSGFQNVDDRDWNRAGAGDAVTVLYAPENPARSVLYRFGNYWVP